jgi:hypothetical protein
MHSLTPCFPIRARDNDAYGLTLLARNPVVMKTDHVRVSGFFSFVNLEYRLNLSAHVTILLTSCDTGNKENVGGVNMIVCMSQVLTCFGKGEMNKGQRYRKECHLYIFILQ